MNTDTNVDIDTLEVSPEEDLLTETDDLDNDEDLEVEYDDDGEGAPADTKPTETQPQNEPTQDPTQQPEAETFTPQVQGAGKQVHPRAAAGAGQQRPGL